MSIPTKTNSGFLDDPLTGLPRQPSQSQDKPEDDPLTAIFKLIINAVMMMLGGSGSGAGQQQDNSSASSLKDLLSFFQALMNPPSRADDGTDTAGGQRDIRQSVATYFNPLNGQNNISRVATELTTMRNNYSGTLKAISPIEAGDGQVTSPFGAREAILLPDGRMSKPGHPGLDIGSRSGSNPHIQATMPGVVVSAGKLGGYGNAVVIMGIDGNTYIEGHLQSIEAGIHQGVEVSQGQRVGIMGHTGDAKGDHVHYEVRVNGKPVNPEIFGRTFADRDFITNSESQQVLAMNQQGRQNNPVVVADNRAPAANMQDTGAPAAKSDWNSMLSGINLHSVQESSAYVPPVPGKGQGSVKGVSG